MANMDPTSQRGMGWLFALVFVMLILAGIWWWWTGAPSERPAADGAEVGMAEGAPLPRT